MLERAKEANITDGEAALYDRQIRLWGLDAQRRLRAAHVLLIGLGGLGAEVAKNLILSGVKAVTLLDHELVTEADKCSQFLVDRVDVGKNRAESSQSRAQQLNPMVEVTADVGSVEDKPDEYYEQFEVVCATSCPKNQLLRIDKICRDKNVMFYAGDVFGFYGFMFADLNEHEYAEEKVKKKLEETTNGSGEPSAKKAKKEENDHQETVTVKKKMSFTPLESVFNIDWSSTDKSRLIKRTPDTFFIMLVLMEFQQQHGRKPRSENLESDKAELCKLRDSVLEEIKVNKDTVPEDFASYSLAELSPVCAVVGGVLAQEIIKAVSQKDQPHNNFFFFNGVSGNGMVDCIKQ